MCAACEWRVPFHAEELPTISITLLLNLAFQTRKQRRKATLILYTARNTIEIGIVISHEKMQQAIYVKWNRKQIRKGRTDDWVSEERQRQVQNDKRIVKDFGETRLQSFPLSGFGIEIEKQQEEGCNQFCPTGETAHDLNACFWRYKQWEKGVIGFSSFRRFGKSNARRYVVSKHDIMPKHRSTYTHRTNFARPEYP